MAKKAGRASSVGDVETFDDLRSVTCRVLGTPISEPDYGELLNLAALYLRTFARGQIPERDRKWMNTAAQQIDWKLGEICRQWRGGEVRHLEEALGWERPKKWDQAAERRRSSHRAAVYTAVVQAMEKGAKTPTVFADVHDSGAFPEEISASIIKKLYYEQKRRQSMRNGRTFQKSGGKAEKTRRT